MRMLPQPALDNKRAVHTIRYLAWFIAILLSERDALGLRRRAQD
jgi:hypothetical protein